MFYRTIQAEATFTYEEKKSEFIAYVCPVKTEAEALGLVASKKKENPFARHVCYAYVLPDGLTMRYSDDGEPQGTAGIPLLDVIKKRGLQGVLVVVVRYFGGVLLGAAGLLRAYVSSAVGAFGQAVEVVFSEVATLSFSVPYPDYDRTVNYLSAQNVKIVETRYDTAVTVILKILLKDVEDFSKSLYDYSGGRFTVERIGVDSEVF